MKKRVFVLVLVLVLVLPMFSIPAYAKYDGEILFRDIPWGITHKEVLEALKNDGIEVDHLTFSFNNTIKGMKALVGGEEMDITLEFAILDSLYSKPEGEQAFYSAEYSKTIRHSDFRTTYLEVEQLYEEFKLKLSSIYGEPDANTNLGYTWYGANGTTLRCHYTDTDNYGFIFYILYESDKAYEDFEERTRDEVKKRQEEAARKREQEAEKKRKEQEEHLADVLSSTDGL